MKRKSDTLAAFKDFKAYMENKTGKKIKRLRKDKGGEYMSADFDTFLKNAGITREHSVRNRPQQMLESSQDWRALTISMGAEGD